MAWFDLVVCTVVGLSLLLGAVRGMVRELVGLAAWFVALLLARALSPSVAGWLPAAVQPDGLRLGLAFGGVVLASVVLASVVTLVLSALVKAAGLTLADRVLGAIFGLGRGILIVLVGVVVAGFTRVPLEPGWRGSVTAPAFEVAARWVSPWLPGAIGSRLKYT